MSFEGRWRDGRDPARCRQSNLQHAGAARKARSPATEITNINASEWEITELGAQS